MTIPRIQGTDDQPRDVRERADAEVQIYRIEIRFDFTGTPQEAESAARRAATLLNGEVTAIVDEDWNDLETASPAQNQEGLSG